MSDFKYRIIDPTSFMDSVGTIDKPLGNEPELKWLKISDLVIDPRYQREIADRGRRNVIKIAKQFDWTKFSPVIVAHVENGLYAIVDGQHHTTSAAIRGIKSVPCMIIKANPNEQASAFAAINGAVTAVTPMQLHHARVAAGEKEAIELETVIAKAGVVICRYPVPADKIKVGQTLAATQIATYFKLYGENVLVAALKCITKTGNGNPGCIRAHIILGLCRVLHAEPDWYKDEAALIKAMNTFNFYENYEESVTYAKKNKVKVAFAFGSNVVDHLSAML